MKGTSMHEPSGLNRRHVLKVLTAMGVGSTVFARAVAAQAEGERQVTAEMIRHAEWIAGVEYTDAERELMLEGLNESLAELAELRKVPLDNDIPPALSFYPVGRPAVEETPRRDARPIEWAARRPESRENHAFAPVTELSALLRQRKVSSTELTRLYLERLHRIDETLKCVITFTDDLAIEQAERADREIAAGRYRGPLHGVPWGVKDLFSHPRYPTTWGAKPYEQQVRREKATVISRLEQAGAVLLAKLSVGALAWGDVWFGGQTKSPWNPEKGSSGSSAGSAAATAAGLVGFAIGTETWGSIVSPCTRCGATGLRPTFGRVSRYGAMALSWTMDKVGPIARSVEDCALVLDAIHGADGLDHDAVNQPFEWPPRRDVRTLRIGYVAELFERDATKGVENEQQKARVAEQQKHDRRTLQTLRDLGLRLVPMKLPESYPIGPMSLILTAEASAAFDQLTRSGRDDRLTRQVANAWPNVFRQGQLIPAVEYIRANRVRTLLLREMEQIMTDIDVYVCPSYGGDNLLLTNLTGHPSVVLPNGSHADDGMPTSITLVGKLFGETDLLSTAHAYQEATDFHTRRPSLAQ
jgi:Asp-tRNA(Asn)/Glu-tRNA(Gln) amidotransferase A subunit family amidase